MRPYEAVFLSVAVGLFLARPRNWWLAALAPALALAAHGLPIGRFGTPVAAIVACLIVPRYAPVALVLAIPTYRDPLDALRAALLWLVVSALIEGLEDRFEDESRHLWVRRVSVRLLSVAVLYYTLLPIMYL